nr:uncharacterized protein LOC112492317 [Ziziphus jujuba var. spinosa]
MAMVAEDELQVAVLLHQITQATDLFIDYMCNLLDQMKPKKYKKVIRYKFLKVMISFQPYIWEKKRLKGNAESDMKAYIANLQQLKQLIQVSSRRDTYHMV